MGVLTVLGGAAMGIGIVAVSNGIRRVRYFEGCDSCLSPLTARECVLCLSSFIVRFHAPSH